MSRFTLYFSNININRICCVYKAPSEYVTCSNLEIGVGLFSFLPIKKNAIIGYYYGVDISKESYLQRRKINKGGYGVQISADVIKDCREAFLQNICLISAANSHLNLMHRVTGMKTGPCSLNAEIVVYRGRAYLKATRIILPNEEILTNYSSSFGCMQP